MSNDCFHPNPLLHGGSSQDLRMVPALDPSTAPLDGRSMDQLLLFLEKYGELLNYYNSKNTISGGWKQFYARDLSHVLARISTARHTDCLPVFYKYYDRIQLSTNLAGLKNCMKVLFDISFTLLDEIRAWNDLLVLKTAAKDMLYGEINHRLRIDLRDLLLYYLAGQPDFVNTGYQLLPGEEDYLPRDTEEILQHNFKEEWWFKYNPADSISDWNFYVTTYLPLQLPSINVFGDPGWADQENIRYGSSFLRSAFTNIYNAYARIVRGAKALFLDSVTKYGGHQPHNAMVISFLHLFRRAQKELNRVTDRHLNFYYKDVLHLERRPPIPDAAHIVFTLAKNANPVILPAGTALIGGKDRLKKELIYKTSDSLTVQHAAIGGLKSVFIDDHPVHGGVFKSEISNSADGNGKELNPEDPSWFAFGSRQSGLPPEERTMTESAPGFIIASPILQLSEGERVITMTIETLSLGPGPFTAGEIAGRMDISLTGKKGWIELPTISSSNIGLPNALHVDTATGVITIKITLDESVDALAGLDPDAHEFELNTQWPVLRCQLREDAPIALYRKLSKVIVKQIIINVEVNNAFTCVLHSDMGGLDPKSPFMPFGSRPKKSSSLYFGSHEVFSKAVESLTLRLKWLGLPPGTSFYDHYAVRKPVPGKSKTTVNGEVSYIDIPDTSAKSFTIRGLIKDGEERDCMPSPSSLFASGNNAIIDPDQELHFSNIFDTADPLMDEFASYDPSLRRGFLRLELTGPPKAFGHEAYSRVFTEQVIAVNKDNTANSLPNAPYTPLLQPLLYDYKASATITPGASNNPLDGQFFLLFPFGYRAMNDDSTVALLHPQVHVDKSGTEQDLQGALYIGIDNCKPNQVLSLYFEFSEGSEDASLDPPGVQWAYLSGNQWRYLDDHIIADDTNTFLGSGVVRFVVPEDMTDKHTAMPATLRWLRVGIGTSYLAYPKLYAVFTNAVKAVFFDQANDLAHLASPVKEGTITKLVTSRAEIRKVDQPYPSFGGSPLELDRPYYTRISERLRHKDRAITIWDYERLVLEKFSYLYKAKCLNHTNETTETAPGHVRVIVIPDMSSKSTGNLYEPRISNNKRKTIKDWLAARNCPFADLQVQNPQYEAIQVQCEVKFHEGLDVTAHIEQLKMDIDKFLAPWAFDESRSIDFGGIIHRSQIIYYMEKLPYVDYVTDFVMNLYHNGVALSVNLDEAKASTSKSILTTYRDHLIGTNTCAS